MGSVERLAGVIVSTSEERFAAMFRFYTDVLDLTPRSIRPGFVNFEWGGLRLTIATHDRVSGPTTEPARHMINFASTDVAADFDRMTGAGAAAIRRPDRESWGGLVATIADPDGNLVQLLEL